MQRDSFIRKNESNNRMKMNQTMDLTQEKLKIHSYFGSIFAEKLKIACLKVNGGQIHPRIPK